MNDFFKKYPFYLILVPIFFLLHSNNELFGFLLAKDIINYLITISLFSGFFFGIFFLLFRSAKKSAIIIFLTSVFFLYFGAYHDFIKNISGESVISSYKIIVPASLLAIGLISGYLFKRPEVLGKITTYLNLLLIILIIVDIAFLTRNIILTNKNHNLIYPNLVISDNYKPSNIPDSAKPDIYFLVLDEYTNNKALNRYWGFDNSAITNWLSSNGFYIIDNGNSNYNFTPFSVSSTLNMNYLPKEKGTNGNIPLYMLQAVKSFSTNETINALTKENYSFRFIIPFQNSIEKTDVKIEFDDFSKKQLYYSTFPGRFEKDILWNFTVGNFSPSKINLKQINEKQKNEWESKGLNIKRVIEKIAAAITDSSPVQKPRFVYGHLMITHKPHYFDSTGAIRRMPDMAAPQNLFGSYVPEIEYANQVVKNLVENIKKRKKNSIIIIEGDHGFRDFPDSIQGNVFANFSAIYFPDNNYNQLYPTMSPVNTFRIVFNHYFYQNFPLLKDSSIIVNY